MEWHFSFTAATQYDIYIWRYGEERPTQPSGSTSRLYFRPSDPFPQNSQILWQLFFHVPGANGTTPGPIWGFVTRPYADLTVSSIDVPVLAYSGDTFDVQFTVENIGGANTAYPDTYGYVARRWYDYIYFGELPRR